VDRALFALLECFQEDFLITIEGLIMALEDPICGAEDESAVPLPDFLPVVHPDAFFRNRNRRPSPILAP
jgi:hypothetical protein